MMTVSEKLGESRVLEASRLDRLFEALRRRGYQVVGPTVRQGDLCLAELATAADLPRGWTEVQEAGRFRLERRSDQALFGYALGQESWKKFLFPPEMRLWQARRRDRVWEVVPDAAAPPRFALMGVRPCELQALAVQDRVFLAGTYVDPTYRGRRQDAFILAVNCGQPGGTCFCASFKTGPRATSGFDLALTEVLTLSRHYLLVEVGTARGAEVLAEMPGEQVRPEEQEAAAEVWAKAARRLGRSLETAGLQELLYRNFEHPHWDDVAGRCLTCGNCALVCPTCFCHSLSDRTDLDGDWAERRRRWDVCFSVEHSYIHGGSIRVSPKARYRQWLTHKLATWVDQFGCFGCVGCGRCLTWCPVGIDLTQEVQALRESDTAAGAAASAGE